MGMNVHVINLTKAKTKLKEILSWCNDHFGEVAQVNYPTTAELYRVSYDNKVTGIVVFYFREETDYFFFMLRWQ